MKKIPVTIRLAILSLAFGSLGIPLAAAETRPNIILIYTDDHGYADLSSQGQESDIRTPHLDALAASGARMLHGYSTAPQCVPSRGGLLVGKFQARFGLESNVSSLDGFNQETTIATRLQRLGYVTAQLGKWHLGPTPEITRHGFTHVFSQNSQRPFSANVSLTGADIPLTELPPEHYHLDACSETAAALIDRYHDQPFFLYLAFRAPHTPLDAPKKYTDRFPGEMPERRRQALAMLSAVDDGVGLITETLARHALTERTLLFVIGDNGAPLKITKDDAPLKGGEGGWDGSLNTPLNGEKGMLAEGGMHVPFLVSWPGTIPGGQVYPHPVSALDVAATAVALTGAEVAPGDLDGVNLIPHLVGETDRPPHEALMWRWIAQSAIREGDWKLLRGGEREYLYNLGEDLEEKHNVADAHPDIATRLRERLKLWTQELSPPGLAPEPMGRTWDEYFDYYLEGKEVSPSAKIKQPNPAETSTQNWLARGGSVDVVDGHLEFQRDGTTGGFLARNQVKIAGPASITITSRSDKAGELSVTWRTDKEMDFLPEHRAAISVEASEDWRVYSIAVPAVGNIIHLRLTPPAGTTSIREITALPDQGKPVTLWKPQP